jgi:ComF family protein
MYPADVCADCRPNRYHGVPAFEAVRSPFGFEGAMRHAVHRFKYQNKTALAAPLAALLHEFVLQSSTRDALHIDEIGAVVAVPLHPWRRYRRGYNQSELLARELGRVLDVSARGLLRRTRHTVPQVELTESKRRENVRGAFALAESAGGRLPATVLLLDDVCTTGATLNECARVLKAGGVSRVYGLTLARSS